jgi:hypothetical protein
LIKYLPYDIHEKVNFSFYNFKDLTDTDKKEMIKSGLVVDTANNIFRLDTRDFLKKLITGFPQKHLGDVEHHGAVKHYNTVLHNGDVDFTTNATIRGELYMKDFDGVVQENHNIVKNEIEYHISHGAFRTGIEELLVSSKNQGVVNRPSGLADK